jgi:hypothetical protein
MFRLISPAMRRMNVNACTPTFQTPNTGNHALQQSASLQTWHTSSLAKLFFAFPDHETSGTYLNLPQVRKHCVEFTRKEHEKSWQNGRYLDHGAIHKVW